MSEPSVWMLLSFRLLFIGIVLFLAGGAFIIAAFIAQHMGR